MELGWSVVGQPAPGNPHYVLDALGTHKEPRKTKDEIEERFRKFCKTLPSCCAKRGPVEVNGEELHPTTDIQLLERK